MSASSRSAHGGVGRPYRPQPRSRGAASGSFPGGGTSPDPFAINPIRRSFALVAVSALIVFGPISLGADVAMSVMVSVGWLALAGLVMGVPILVWCLAEEGWRLLNRRLHPRVDQLGLPPRVAHILTRHGLATIDDVDRASDATLLLLSNMDARGLRDIRRAINLRKYRRWQERGFPVTGYD